MKFRFVCQQLSVGGGGNSGRWIRTTVLLVMSQTSCRCSIPRSKRMSESIGSRQNWVSKVMTPYYSLHLPRPTTLSIVAGRTTPIWLNCRFTLPHIGICLSQVGSKLIQPPLPTDSNSKCWGQGIEPHVFCYY